MFQLLRLAILPVRLVIKLFKLPFTIISCVTKLGCMLVVIGIPLLEILQENESKETPGHLMAGRFF